MSRHRQSTTPMDFEWENATGRVDHNSPFITSQQQHSAKKRKLSSFASVARADGAGQAQRELNKSHPFGAPGTHSVFDSPSKNPFSSPNRPQLREPNGQHYLFSSPGQKPLPSIPPHVQTPRSRAWEPRTPQSVVDFSSGGETPNTPAQDSDAATPDTQLASRMDSLSHGVVGAGVEKRKSKRDSIMGFFGRSSPSPTKDDRERERRAYSKKAEHRVMKRRSKKSKHASAEDYDSDNQLGPASSRRNNAMVPAADHKPATGILANIPGALSWVEAHPNLPMVLSYYMQFVINATLGFIFLYIVYSALMAIFHDVTIEASLKEREIMHDIAVCVDHYRKNGCDVKNRVPVLEQPCQAWEFCMKQDARRIAKASVGAKAGAKILNSFTEEFSYKSMLFTAIVLFGGFNLSNWAFNRIRKDQPPPYPAYDYPPHIPATPQRQISVGYGGMMDQGQQAWQTPSYNTPYGSVQHQRPLLQHASQSLPALPSSGGAATAVAAQEGDLAALRGSPAKKAWLAKR